jgi:hypothetical protein
MKKGQLSREHAIEIVGLANVEAVEAENAEQTGQLTNDGTVEFAARLVCTNKNGDAATLTIYWYQDEDDMNVTDLSDLDWENTVSGYEID